MPAAQRAARQLQEKLDQQNEDHGSIAWFEASMDFIRRAGLKPSTRRSYTFLVEGVMTSSLGNFKLTSLTHDDLRRFIQEKRKTYVVIRGVKTKTQPKLTSDATIRRHLSFMSAVFRWSIEQQLPGAPNINPLDNFDRKSLKESKPVDRHLRKSQFEMILENTESEEDKRILIVLVGTGMRLSEFLELRWGEVDLKNRVIEFGNMDPDRTKSSRARRIPILDPVHTALTAQCAASFSGEGGYVFPSPVGGGRRYGLSSLMKRVRTIPGLEKFRIHDLRHTFASWALQNGIDPIAISSVLGHTSLYITSRYARHVPDSVMQAFKNTGLF